jgi:glutathione-regulated potassium-efflux system ancillary protein KefC
MGGHGFLTNAIIFMTAAVIAVPISKRLGLGSVLGYLLAGLAIGPPGLRLVTNVSDILHFSELGVVLLLFIIGLELEPRKLWTMRRSVVGTGSAQVLGCTTLLGAAALTLGADAKAALVIGLAFSMSSTAMAIQLYAERNFNSTTGGKTGFSILLFQDIAVILVLAALPLLGAGDSSVSLSDRALGAAKLVGIFATVIVSGRYLLRALLRIVAKTQLREIFTAFALLLVVAMAALMQRLDLSMGLGAFLAGVLLADSEYRHALETDLEPFKGLLLGLFFISVGMSIDAAIVMQKPGIVAAIVAGIMAVKFLLHLLLAKFTGIPRSQAALFAVSIAQVGEFAFVVFGAAQQLGLLSATTSALLIAASVMTMLVTPIAAMGVSRLFEIRSQDRRRDADAIEDSSPAVIIAGFGRFGQIIGRLLYANGIAATVLDHEPDQIELLRRFGFKVYYGDATRLDLLEAAGARSAKILVVAVDDVQANLAIVDLAREHFPHLKTFCRARNVDHMYELLDRDVAAIERETFESSLALGASVLTELGFARHQAVRAGHIFREHNLAMISQLAKRRDDQSTLVAGAKAARDQLERIFEKERELRAQADSGWES